MKEIVPKAHQADVGEIEQGFFMPLHAEDHKVAGGIAAIDGFIKIKYVHVSHVLVKLLSL